MQNGVVCWPMFTGISNRTAFLSISLHETGQAKHTGISNINTPLMKG